MKNAALAGLLGVGMVASVASADIVHFVNPAPGQAGHYDWRWPANTLPPSWLDITLGPDAQPNTRNRTSVAQAGWGSWLDVFNETWDGAAVGVHEDEFYGRYTRAFAQGEPLAGATFHHEAMHFYASSEAPPPPWGWSFFPEGERAYIGVLTTDGQHGWIEVERFGASLTAYGWAYETTPGVPIVAGQVPAPGAAVLMAAGVFGVASRRRRS